MLTSLRLACRLPAQHRTFRCYGRPGEPRPAVTGVAESNLSIRATVESLWVRPRGDGGLSARWAGHGFAVRGTSWYDHTDCMDVKTKKAAQFDLTHDLLIRVARELFTERGYAESATEEVVKRAGVTRGALYHHFRDKRHLFVAVFKDVERDLTAQLVAAASKEPDAWSQLRAGRQAFLDAMLEPAVQRIVLIDGPAVLGWDGWRQIDANYGLGLFVEGLRAATQQGFLERQPVEPLAQVLVGAIREAALVIARAERPSNARREVGATIDKLFEGLRRKDVRPGKRPSSTRSERSRAEGSRSTRRGRL